MLLILLGVAIATLLVYLRKHYNDINKFWEERGVPHKKPMKFFGNSFGVLIRKTSAHKFHEELYNSFPDTKFIGFYDFTKPTLVVKDVELVERILIKDFHHFVDRGVGPAEGSDPDPIDVNIFNMSGKKWKAMRNKFSPMFTTGKLKHMVPQISNISDALMMELEKNPSDVDMKDMSQRFSMDVIASCAFGLDINTLQEKEESEFRKMGKVVFKFSMWIVLRFLVHATFPKLAKKMRLPQANPVAGEYFSRVLKETLEQRRNTNLTRNDFVQLMVSLQQKGSIEFEGDESDEYLKMGAEEKNEKHIENYELTDDVMAGQAFIFLAAGFEATANALMWLLYELAQNPEAQEKARREITKVTEARGGELDYDALKEMTYFNQCVQESLRMHSFVPVLFRICTKEYTFPGTSLTIQPRQPVLIPITGLHNDPEHFPEPDKFKPERFDPDVKIPSCTYLPFGDGPRICIAMRFALTEIKLCGARFLRDYSFKLSPKTVLPIALDPTLFVLTPKDPLYFNLTKVNDVQKIGD